MRAFQQYRAVDYKIKIQRIPNLAGNEYNMRRPGMEGHLLFNKAVTKWTRKTPRTPNPKIHSDERNRQQRCERGAWAPPLISECANYTKATEGFVLRCEL